jgi:hypothetical protein
MTQWFVICFEWVLRFLVCDNNQYQSLIQLSKIMSKKVRKCISQFFFTVSYSTNVPLEVTQLRLWSQKMLTMDKLKLTRLDVNLDLFLQLSDLRFLKELRIFRSPFCHVWNNFALPNQLQELHLFAMEIQEADLSLVSLRSLCISNCYVKNLILPDSLEYLQIMEVTFTSHHLSLCNQKNLVSLHMIKTKLTMLDIPPFLTQLTFYQNRVGTMNFPTETNVCKLNISDTCSLFPLLSTLTFLRLRSMRPISMESFLVAGLQEVHLHLSYAYDVVPLCNLHQLTKLCIKSSDTVYSLRYLPYCRLLQWVSIRAFMIQDVWQLTHFTTHLRFIELKESCMNHPFPDIEIGHKLNPYHWIWDRWQENSSSMQ